MGNNQIAMGNNQIVMGNNQIANGICPSPTGEVRWGWMAVCGVIIIVPPTAQNYKSRTTSVSTNDNTQLQYLCCIFAIARRKRDFSP